MIDTLTITLLTTGIAALGFFRGKFNSRCAHSSCMWELFEIDGADSDITFLKEQERKEEKNEETKKHKHCNI